MQRMKQMRLDPELVAMNRVSEVLKYLEHGQRRRVVDWAKARFNLIEERPLEVVTTAEIPILEEISAPPFMEPMTVTPPARPAPLPEPEVDTRAGLVEEEKTNHKPGVVKRRRSQGKIFADFDTIDDLFLRASTKKVSHRILLVAAYLQEKGNLDYVSSLDINAQLKKLGYGVSNITTLINGLVKKTPPQIVVIEKDGGTKQSRRKFKVTEKGFKDAKSFIEDKGNN